MKLENQQYKFDTLFYYISSESYHTTEPGALIETIIRVSFDFPVRPEGYGIPQKTIEIYEKKYSLLGVTENILNYDLPLNWSPL